MPRSPKKFTNQELLNQKRFKLVNDYLKPFKDLLKVGFKNYYTETGGLRGAISYTLKNALIQQEGHLSIDETMVKISGGELPKALNPVVNVIPEGILTVSWESGAGSKPTDQLILLAYHVDTGQAVSLIYDGPLRKTGLLELMLPLTMHNKWLDIYIGFIAADRSAQSDSQYLGRFLG